MNTKRIFFWLCFVVILGLIVWGLIVASNKPAIDVKLGDPAPVTAIDHSYGPANAKAVVIEYGDFQCPACGAYASLVERLMTDASTTMRVVFRHFPLSQHLNARIAAQASEAAASQGKFWEMYRLLYTNQSEWSDASDADARKIFASYASDLGLNAAKFATDIDSAAAKKIIDDQYSEGQTLGISYTPTFFVNGKGIANPQSYEEFKAIIDKAVK
jgi:protein-disulfide isomerase